MPRGDEKARRMEIRRSMGDRKPKPPSRAREAHFPPYLFAHACFSCRCSFKRAREDGPDPPTCPNCGGPLFEMGRSFKAPARSDVKQWRKIQTLYAHGFRFFSYRSHDCEPLPKSLREVDDFVRNNPDHPFKTGTPDPSLLPDKQE